MELASLLVEAHPHTLMLIEHVGHPHGQNGAYSGEGIQHQRNESPVAETLDGMYLD
ncbi:hypothetical protein D3C85_1885230 [compost metagenome]